MHNSISLLSKSVLEYRRLIGLVAFLFILSSGLFAQTPLASYPLNGNASDISGNGLNGTIVGALTPTADRFGNASGAMQFGGSGQVDIGGNLADQNFTVSMWLKPGSTQVQFADIIDNNHSGFQNWVLQQDDNTLNRYVFGVHRSSGGLGVFFNLTANVWQHVVLVKSATAVEAYINGVLDQTTAWTGTVNYVSPFLRLGNFSGGGRLWNGGMDEVKYFNTALNQSQVAALFNEIPLPIAYFPLDGNANDVSVNALNGTITGTVTPVSNKFGQTNSAMSFSGGSRIDVADNPLLRPANVTLNSWVFSASVIGGTEVIASKNVCNGSIESFATFFFNGHVAAAWTDGNGSEILNGPVLSAGQWHMVTLTFDDVNNTGSLYVDGVLVDSKTTSLTLFYDNSSFSIGSELEQCSPNFGLNASVDEVKIFGQALNQTQVTALFNEAAPTGQPIAYYPFTGNANDAIGSLNGTVNGATLTTDRFGNANSAYSFDGVNDAISFSALPMNNIDNFTLMAWVNPAVFDPANQFNKMIVSLGPGDNGYNYGMGNASGSGTGNQLGALYNFVSWIPSGAFFTTTNTWYHTALVRENGVTKFYLNGVQAPNTSNATPNQMTSDFQIGGQSFDPTHYWNGKIDEVKIYNTALTGTQIQEEFLEEANFGGQFGNNVLLNGANDHITIPNNSALNPSAVTVETWVRPSAFTSTKLVNTDRQYIVFKQNTRLSAFEGYAVQMLDGCKCFEANVSSESGANAFVRSATNSVELGKDYHVVLVANSTELKLYMNGVLQGTSPTGFALDYGSKPVFIGRSGENTFEGFFNGLVDEVRIWNTARSQTEIQSTINTQLSGSETGLVGYWDMNRTGQGAGLVVDNKATATGSALNGTTEGSASTPIFESTAPAVRGEFGNSLQLTAPGDFVSIPGSPVLNLPNDVTVEAWVKIENSLSGEKQVFINSIEPDNWGCFLAVIGSQPTFGVVIGGSQTNVTSPESITLNEWHHIVGIREGGTIKIMVNGVVKATANPGTGNLRSGSGIHKIGQSQGNGSNFIGFIDELRVWNFARSTAQIQSTFNQQLSGNETGLVGYWDMNRNGQGAGLTLANKATVSGTAIDGTTQGTTLTPIFSEGNAQNKPGSGNAISFDGVNDVIQVPNSAFNNFTMELWMNTSQTGPSPGGQAFSGAGILSADLSSTSSGDFFPMALNGNFITFGTGDGGDNTITANRPVVDGNWHHVAVTRNQTTGEKKIYVDGIEAASGTGSGLAYNASSSVFIGADFFDNVFYQGKLDEVRFWDIAMTPAQIRDRMCRKITNSDALFGNLVAYYNFDETLGNTVFDGTANANDGTLINGPTRITSGAAIGNTSTHNYVTSGFPTANLSFNSQDNLTIAYTAGTFIGEAGTHIYSVSEKPNTETGIEGAGTNNRYFGVFNAGLTNPQYSASYNYNGNSFVTAGNESQLALFKRNDNAGTNWISASATLNTTANTLTATGQSTEYVLGVGPCVPPPVPTITSGGQTSFCANASLDLISSAATGNQWTKGGVDIVGATSNTLTATEAGTYAVRVTQSTCFSTSANLVITTKTVPTVGISASAPALCEGNPVVLSTTGTALASREWLKDGATTNQFGTTFSASVAGSYSVIGTAANGCKATSSAFNIQTDVVPVLSSDKPANTVCSANPIVLSVSSGASFLWNTAATTSSITVSPSTDSEFSVRTTGSLGCVFDDTIQITVVPSLTPTAVSNMLPENGSINQENSILFSWQPGANALSYDLYIWPAPGARPATPSQLGIPGIATNLGNLTFGTLYNYQVVSQSACISTNGPVQQFTTRNLPDLAISNLVSQPTLGTPGILSVTYTVTNSGTGVSLPGSWKDQLFLSIDSAIGNDILLLTKDNVNALSPGASYNGSFQTSVNLVGPYFLYVKTDANASVTETNENNNLHFRNPGKVQFIQAQPSPDLVGIGQAFTPSNAVGDQAILFSYSVQNQGNKDARGTTEDNSCVPENCVNATDFTWQDDVYISPSATFDGQARFLGRVTVNPRLLRNSSLLNCNTCNSYQTKPTSLEIDSFMVVTSSSLRIPHDYSGQAFIHIRLNQQGSGNFSELVKENNGIVSNSFNVILRPPADLEVTQLILTPTSTQQGSNVKVKYRITNIGANSPKAIEIPWTDKIYLSKTSILNRNLATVLYSKSFTGSTFNPNLSYTDSVTFQVPFVEQTPLYVFVETDVNHNVFEHTFETNNLSTAQELTLDLTKKPDYVPSAFTAPTTVQAGSAILLQYQAANTGNAGGVGSYSVSYTLTPGSGAPFTSSGTNLPISASSSGPISFTLNTPTSLAAGSYQLSILLDAGNTQPELNEGNNSLTRTITVTAAPAYNLALNTLTHPATIDIFQNQPSFDVSGQASYSLVQNGPGIPTEVIGTVLISPNSNGAAPLYTKTFTLSFPGGIPSSFAIPAQTINRNTVPEGNYFVVMSLITNADQFEISPANNVISQSVFFTASPKPDVVIQTAPSSLSLASGGSFSIPLELKNLGVNELTGKVVTRAILSNSPSTNPDVGFATIGTSFSLPGISSMPTNALIKDTIKGSIPLSYSGNYFLQLVTEADKNIWEGLAGEANNIVTIPVSISAPVLPDLRPDALALPATIEAGRSLSFNYTLRNIGAGSFAGTPKNTFRMSRLGVFDPITDVETGQDQEVVNLNAGANVSLPSSMVVSGLLPGPYRPGVFANSNFASIESNYTNNEVYAASTRNIFINPLNLDITASENNFNGDYFYRSVTIGAGLDILAEFSGSEAYASKDNVPTASTSDFASAEDGANELIIPGSTAGQYFFGVAPNAGGITSLKVRALPFSILSLSPNKVGQGNATTEIKGAAFNNQTLFLLLNGAGTVVDTGSVRKLKNSMQARVTFHCSNLALGFYTVRAIKPNLDTFDLANGLQVQAKSANALVIQDNLPAEVKGSSVLPVDIRFINVGNTDVENAFGSISFPAFSTAKNVVVSGGADGLKSLNAKMGIYDLDGPISSEEIDFVHLIPVWRRNVAPGEEFKLTFDLDRFLTTDGLPVSKSAQSMNDESYYKMLANQVEKLRALSIQKKAEIENTQILDSLGGFWSFQRLAFQNLRNAGFFNDADMAAIKTLNYYPSMYQGTMDGYGTVFNLAYIQDLSLRYLCPAPFEEYNFPVEKTLYLDYEKGVFVTYSSNFRRTASDLIATACAGNEAVFLNRVGGNSLDNGGINRGGGFRGTTAKGFVYGPVIYANVFGAFIPNGSRTGSSTNPAPQAGGAFAGGNLGFNNQRELFHQPEEPTPPPPTPPTPVPAPAQPDPIPTLPELAPPDYKNPQPFCANFPMPPCTQKTTGPKNPRCGPEYTVCTFTFCNEIGSNMGAICYPNQPFYDEKCTKVRYSCDPNEIEGPEGLGTSKFVAKTDSLAYIIRFENDPDFAEAAAGTVRILQPLDSNFQANSLKMKSFGFGNNEYPVAGSVNNFSTQIDLSVERGIKVNVLGTLDVVNKQIFWQFTTIDAATGQPSADPAKGFLPVNDSTGIGEGFVSYIIMAGNVTETGDSLRAQAEIFFDFNEPIKTNRHWNVVDALPPTTSVSTPTGSQAETDIVLSWTAADEAGGSGAFSTWIFFKKDGGNLDTLGQFPADTGTVTGTGFETGHAYQFFFQSNDLVGNLEDMPAEPNVTITVGEPCNVPTPNIIALGPLTFCGGDSVVLKTDRAFGNLWSNGDTTQSIAVYESGTYTVRTVAVGCTSLVSTPVVVVVNPLPAKPILTPSGPTTFCQGGSVSISTNAAAGHRWSTGSALNSITVNASITVVDTAKILGCTAVSDPITVTVNPLPVVNAGMDVSIEPGQSTNLTATGATTYLWSPLVSMTPVNGIGATVSVNPIQTTEYTVMGTDGNQCSASDAVRVSVTGGSGPLTAPVISPGTGTYSGPQMFTITSTSPGAEIYFTTSGNTPVVGTGFTKLYTAPFQLLKTSTVRAMAVKAGQANSGISVSFLTISSAGIVETPVISPASGTFEGFVNVSITCSTPEAQIYFTTNGNLPSIGSSFTKLYSASFPLYATATVRAMAIRGGLVNSAFALANFTVNNPAIVATPTFSPVPGNFGAPQNITLSTNTPNAQIYFTTNGNVPRLDVPNSFTKLYNGPFVMSQSATVRAIAVRTNWLQSSTAVGVYTFGGARLAILGTTEEENYDHRVLVFPNPSANGIFHVEMPFGSEMASRFTIIAMDGKEIQKGEMSPGSILQLDLSAYPAGLYNLKIDRGDRQEIIRLSKQ